MTAKECEFMDCTNPASYRVRARRGESILVCTDHKDDVSSSLISTPTVERLKDHDS